MLFRFVFSLATLHRIIMVSFSSLGITFVCLVHQLNWIQRQSIATNPRSVVNQANVLLTTPTSYGGRYP